MSGHLLPVAFVEECLASRAIQPDDAAFRRRLARVCEQARRLGPSSSIRAVVEVGALPLIDVLGIIPLARVVVRADHALVPCRAVDSSVLMVVTPWGARLDAAWRAGAAEAASMRADWCLLFNGSHVRLFPVARLHSRRAVDLELNAAADDPATASALQMICGARGLGGSGAESLASLVRAADAHAAGVCRSLRQGVLDASHHVLAALVRRERTREVADIFEQSLTIVYRLLFLLFAEARGLVPLWHPIYRESYSIDALREAALDRHAVGLWDAMRASSRLAHAGCAAGSLKVTAFNGRLFSPARTPLAERRDLDDREARHAILALSTRPAPDREGTERISYRDLGVEQLGAVYETLLDYTPHVERARGSGNVEVSLRPGSGVRKDTGTFYTPQSLVTYLLRDTLAPLVDGATPEQILNLKVLDPSMGSGAFLVGACRHLADAYERALVAHGRCHPADIGASERASMRRLVAERCLFGVDINPTAVQLARLSLWLTTLAADKPLTFLDHRLRTGDSLAGTWMSLLRSAPRRRHAATGLPLFGEEAATAAIRHALPVRFRLADGPNDTAAQVRDKERALADLTAADTPLGRWTRVADAWCAAWLSSPPLPATAFASLADTILSDRHSLSPRIAGELLNRIEAMSAARRLFHWELEFPEVFFDEGGGRRPHGGFDAVIGNPPWDMVRADTHGNRAAAAPEAASLLRFTRDSGVYVARSNGHANRYQLFLERAIALTRPGGRIGLVLPSGLLTDAGSAAVRRLMFSRCAVERIVGFDNRKATFPIHRSVRFVLLSARAGQATTELACRFGEVDAASLEGATTADERPNPSWYPIRVSLPLIEKLSGPDLAVPDMRTARDLRVAERAAELFAPLGSPEGWHVQFGRELNATEDRALLRSDGQGLPVLEGKSIEPFRVTAGRPRWTIAGGDAVRAVGRAVHRRRLAYRDVASATNRVTLIAALLPPHSASTHTLFCLKQSLPVRQQHLLCAFLNSLVVNFLVRLRVTTHVTTAIVERLPIPREHEAGEMAGDLIVAAEALAQGDDPALFARINAQIARIYALDDDDFSHVLDRFPLIPRQQRTAMLDQFHRT